MHSVTSNAVATNINTVIGNNTFEINQPAIPLAQRKRNNIQQQSEEIYSINLINENRNGLSIDFNYTSSSITVYKIVNGESVGAKSVYLS